MAGFLLSRALIFGLLVCASHCYQIKTAGGGGSGPGVAGVPGDPSLGLRGVLTLNQGVPEGSQSGSGAVVVPVGPGYYPAGAAVPPSGAVGAAAVYEPSWRLAPQPFEGPSTSDSSAGGGGGSDSFGPDGTPLDFFPPGPVLPEFTAGELSHVEKTFEHGSNDHESERQGEFPRRNFGVLPDGSFAAGPGDGSLAGAGSVAFNPFPPGNPGFPGRYLYPYYDWQFLTGQYPPGTVSHFSSTYEQGKDSYRDSHFNKYFYPVPHGPVIPTHPYHGKVVQQVQVDAQS